MLQIIKAFVILFYLEYIILSIIKHLWAALKSSILPVVHNRTLGVTAYQYATFCSTVISWSFALLYVLWWAMLCFHYVVFLHQKEKAEWLVPAHYTGYIIVRYPWSVYGSASAVSHYWTQVCFWCTTRLRIGSLQGIAISITTTTLPTDECIRETIDIKLRVCGSAKHSRKEFVLSHAMPVSVYGTAYVLFTRNGCETDPRTTLNTLWPNFVFIVGWCERELMNQCRNRFLWINLRYSFTPKKGKEKANANAKGTWFFSLMIFADFYGTIDRLKYSVSQDIDFTFVLVWCEHSFRMLRILAGEAVVWRDRL